MIRTFRLLAAGLLGLALIAPLPAAAGPVTSAAVTGSARPLGDGVGLYPRLIRLAHSGRADGQILASTVTFDGAAGVGAIFRSSDDGRSFTRIGTVADPDAGQGLGLCCATLYELPRRVGALPAGTLLWSASVGQAVTTDRRMSLPVYASRDHGRTWTHLATPAVATNSGGLWEPEFSISRSGVMAMVYSDETDQPAHSQTLMARRTRDGVHWSRAHPVVVSTDPQARPGMAVIRRLGTGPRAPYLMTYEVCGGDYGCRVHYRTSADGLHWGDPADLGPTITATDGTAFVHTPNIAWTPTRHRAGRLFLVGQILVGPDGQPAAGNGRTVLVSDHGVGGPWRPIAAPVAVTDPYDNYCPNYSSALLPVGRRSLLEVATGYDATGACTAAFGVGRG